MFTDVVAIGMLLSAGISRPDRLPQLFRRAMVRQLFRAYPVGVRTGDSQLPGHNDSAAGDRVPGGPGAEDGAR